jgi:hypothetical protein
MGRPGYKYIATRAKYPSVKHTIYKRHRQVFSYDIVILGIGY